MKYYLIKLLTNTAGQDGSSISVFTEKDKALVSYHQTLATFHNAADVLFAVVQVVNENGNALIMETVDHRQTPEPETEAEAEE